MLHCRLVLFGLIVLNGVKSKRKSNIDPAMIFSSSIKKKRVNFASRTPYPQPLWNASKKTEGR